MPHAAVGVGLGFLAAGAITAIVTKEIIDNWDEITDKYNHFADKMEEDHDVHLPRFRNGQYAQARSSYGGSSRSMHSRYTNARTSSTTGYRPPSPAVYATGREEFHVGLTSRSDRFTDTEEVTTSDRTPTPDHAYQYADQEGHDDDDDADFKAAIAASLRESATLLDSEDYDTPEYPKADGIDRSVSTTPRSPVQLFPETLPSATIVSEDDETWSERWTNSEGSDHSGHQHEQEWDGSDFSHSDHADDQAQDRLFGA